LKEERSLRQWLRSPGLRETEDQIAAETKATIRCIPFARPNEKGKCMANGRPSESRVVFARTY
jgi:prolyl-tRNA synthetase